MFSIFLSVFSFKFEHELMYDEFVYYAGYINSLHCQCNDYVKFVSFFLLNLERKEKKLLFSKIVWITSKTFLHLYIHSHVHNYNYNYNSNNRIKTTKINNIERIFSCKLFWWHIHTHTHTNSYSRKYTSNYKCRKKKKFHTQLLSN